MTNALSWARKPRMLRDFNEIESNHASRTALENSYASFNEIVIRNLPFSLLDVALFEEAFRLLFDNNLFIFTYVLFIFKTLLGYNRTTTESLLLASKLITTV